MRIKLLIAVMIVATLLIGHASAVDFMPPSPINLANDSSVLWINYSWEIDTIPSYSSQTNTIMSENFETGDLAGWDVGTYFAISTGFKFGNYSARSYYDDLSKKSFSNITSNFTANFTISAGNDYTNTYDFASVVLTDGTGNGSYIGFWRGDSGTGYALHLVDYRDGQDASNPHIFNSSVSDSKMYNISLTICPLCLGTDSTLDVYVEGVLKGSNYPTRGIVTKFNQIWLKQIYGTGSNHNLYIDNISIENTTITEIPTANITDSFNVSISNNSLPIYWINGTSTQFLNSSLTGRGQWSNITVYSYNSSGTGSLNQTPISQQTQTLYTSISGYVKEGTTPLQNARVSVNSSSYVLTDVNGYYSITLEDGTYNLTAKKSWYEPNKSVVNQVISNNSLENINISLIDSPNVDWDSGNSRISLINTNQTGHDFYWLTNRTVNESLLNNTDALWYLNATLYLTNSTFDINSSTVSELRLSNCYPTGTCADGGGLSGDGTGGNYHINDTAIHSWNWTYNRAAQYLNDTKYVIDEYMATIVVNRGYVGDNVNADNIRQISISYPTQGGNNISQINAGGGFSISYSNSVVYSNITIKNIKVEGGVMCNYCENTTFRDIVYMNEHSSNNVFPPVGYPEAYPYPYTYGGVGFTLSYGNNNSVINYYGERPGMSGLGPQECERNFIARNITIINGSHNGLDIHGASDIDIDNITIYHSLSNNFLITTTEYQQTNCVQYPGSWNITIDDIITGADDDTNSAGLQIGINPSYNRTIDNITITNWTSRDNGTAININSGYVNNFTVSNITARQTLFTSSGDNLFIRDAKIISTYFQQYNNFSTKALNINKSLSGQFWALLGAYREYYYIDINVTDSIGNPINDATVTFTTVENSDLTNTSINGNGISKTVTTTGIDGHIPLPSNINNTIGVLEHRQYSGAGSQNNGYFTYYNTSISVNDSSKIYLNKNTSISNIGINTPIDTLNSTIINPDSSWYRSNPNTYQNTTTIQLPQATNWSILPDTTINVNASSDKNLTASWSGSATVLFNTTIPEWNSTTLYLKHDGTTVDTKSSNSTGFVNFSYTGTNGTFNVSNVSSLNITSWENSKTLSASLDFTLNASEPVKFNITANQTITIYNWYVNGIDQSNNFDNFTISWNTTGLRIVIANATNSNGTSNSIQWNVTVNNIYNISSCGISLDSGGQYTIIQNITSNGECITINADNIILTGINNSIIIKLADEYNQVVNSLINSTNFDNITIKDMILDGNNVNNTGDFKQTGIQFKNGSDSTISNITIQHFGRLATPSSMGINIGINSTNVTISNNTFSDVTDGINGQAGTANNNITIINNKFISTNRDYAINLFYFNNSIVRDNVISNSYYDGIRIVNSYNNTISNNTIQNGASGIGINTNSYDNIIISNTIQNNSNYGIKIYSTSTGNNTIYNNIFNNTININSAAASNIWNTTKTLGSNIVGGNFLGGNSWSDYTGDDTNGDGIGETSYIIDADDIDYFPLTKASTSSEETSSSSGSSGSDSKWHRTGIPTPPTKTIYSLNIQYNETYIPTITKYKTKQPILLGVYSIITAPDCSNPITIERKSHNIIITTTCSFSYISIDFIVSNQFYDVYQLINGVSTLIPQKLSGVSLDDDFYVITATPSSMGNFILVERTDANSFVQLRINEVLDTINILTATIIDSLEPYIPINEYISESNNLIQEFISTINAYLPL